MIGAIGKPREEYFGGSFIHSHRTYSRSGLLMAGGDADPDAMARGRVRLRRRFLSVSSAAGLLALWAWLAPRQDPKILLLIGLALGLIHTGLDGRLCKGVSPRPSLGLSRMGALVGAAMLLATIWIVGNLPSLPWTVICLSAGLAVFLAGVSDVRQRHAPIASAALIMAGLATFLMAGVALLIMPRSPGLLAFANIAPVTVPSLQTMAAPALLLSLVPLLAPRQSLIFVTACCAMVMTAALIALMGARYGTIEITDRPREWLQSWFSEPALMMISAMGLGLVVLLGLAGLRARVQGARQLSGRFLNFSAIMLAAVAITPIALTGYALSRKDAALAELQSLRIGDPRLVASRAGSHPQLPDSADALTAIALKPNPPVNTQARGDRVGCGNAAREGRQSVCAEDGLTRLIPPSLTTGRPEPTDNWSDLPFLELDPAPILQCSAGACRIVDVLEDGLATERNLEPFRYLGIFEAPLDYGLGAEEDWPALKRVLTGDRP